MRNTFPLASVNGCFDIRHVQPAKADQTQTACRIYLETRVQPPCGRLNTCQTCNACGAVTRGSYPYRANAWYGDFLPPVEPTDGSGETNAANQLGSSQAGDNGLARGCVWLEREVRVSNLSLIVWPAGERGIVAAPDIAVASFQHGNDSAPFVVAARRKPPFGSGRGRTMRLRQRDGAASVLIAARN